MASTLKVQNIAHTGGTAAMTVNNNGTMTPSKMVYATFRIADHVTVSAQDLITNWETMPSPCLLYTSDAADD